MKFIVKKNDKGASLEIDADGGKLQLPPGMMGKLNSMLQKAQNSPDYNGTLELVQGKWRIAESMELSTE